MPFEFKGKEGIAKLKSLVIELDDAALETLLEAIEAEEESLNIAAEAARLSGKPNDEIATILKMLSWVKGQKAIITKEIARRLAGKSPSWN